MSKAVRRSVPLNSMCSRKWLTPTRLGGSSRAPVLSHTPRASERRPGSSSLSTVSPLASWVRWGWQSSARWLMATPGGRARLRRKRKNGLRGDRPRRGGTLPEAVVERSVTLVGGLSLRLGEKHLARQLDLALAIHTDHLDAHDVAELEHVLDARRALVVDLRDVQQAVAPGHDLEEGSERDDGAHLGVVDAADLGILDDVADHLLGPLAALHAIGRDTHLAGVLDVDLGAGLFLNAL